MIIRKGMNKDIDSYSCFFDNNHQNDTGLNGYLKGLGVTELYFCGLAGDFCVLYSILDAIDLGYKTSLIVDATKAVDEENFPHKKAMINKRGCNLIASEHLWEKKEQLP